MGHRKIYPPHGKTPCGETALLRSRGVYEHGTHFVFPDGMLKTMFPVGSALFVKLAFSAAKKYPKECKTARIDIDRRMTHVICDWRDKK